VRFLDPIAGRTKEGKPARVLEAVWIQEWERWASIDTNGMSASLWRDDVFRKMFMPEGDVAIQTALFSVGPGGGWR
jgi:hypothetical protein